MDGTEAGSTRARKTVLIVDDDPGILHVLADGIDNVLDLFEVVTASDGREAVEILESRVVDAIVTDLNMPVMDGFALIAHSTNRTPPVPLVVLSGLAPSEVDERLARYGGLRVLFKPVSYRDVADCLLQLMQQVALGHVEGIALAGILQLVESERRSCAIIVTSRRRKGRLFFQSGRLINAFSEDFGADGEAAAYDILGWDDTAIAFEPLPDDVRRQIHTPMQLMLIEVAVVQDQLRERTERSIPPAPESASDPAHEIAHDRAPDPDPEPPHDDLDRPWSWGEREGTDVPAYAPDGAHEQQPDTYEAHQRPDARDDDAVDDHAVDDHAVSVDHAAVDHDEAGPLELAAQADQADHAHRADQDVGASGGDGFDRVDEAAAHAATSAAHEADGQPPDRPLALVEPVSEEAAPEEPAPEEAAPEEAAAATAMLTEPALAAVAGDSGPPDEDAGDAPSNTLAASDPLSSPVPEFSASTPLAVAGSAASRQGPTIERRADEGGDVVMPEGRSDAHTTRLVEAVERLTQRARDADAALAAVTEEIEAFRSAQRHFDEVNEQRERRFRELESFRHDVARLARDILDRVDDLFESAPDLAAADVQGGDPPQPTT